MTKKLYKSDDKVIAGIIGGLGEYFEVDATILRLGYILVTIMTGVVPAIIAYVIAYFIVPQKPTYQAKEATYTETPKTEEPKQ